MFVQVFQGPVSDAEQVRALMDRWKEELSPGADGWLGSTAGVTDDGTFIGLARFESEEAAQRNSDRPEQGAWWEQLAAQFTAEPEFRNSITVDTDIYDDPDAAGFVQVMQGRTNDPDRARELMQSDPTDWQTFRPDVLGSINIGHEGGEWTMAIYFASEEAAREGEQKEPPPELQATMEEMNSLNEGEPRYYDLRDPWLAGPA
jgi:hypothetical protein